MPLRALGNTGVKVPIVGLGTAELGRPDWKVAVAVVRRAVELGITYIDTAPTYGRTRSEERIGIALGGARKNVFLTTKTLERKRDGALSELDQSLKRLRTDHVDLWQFHALRSDDDNDAILKKGGALEAGLQAQKDGRVRYLGITGHYDPTVFRNMLRQQRFDTLLIPLNCIDPWHRSFETTLLPYANYKNVGVIAMKVYCSGRLPKDSIVTAEDCLRYTCGLPAATTIVGCQSVREVELVAHVARNLKPMDGDERKKLRAATKPHSPDLEWYKRK